MHVVHTKVCHSKLKFTETEKKKKKAGNTSFRAQLEDAEERSVEVDLWAKGGFFYRSIKALLVQAVPRRITGHQTSFSKTFE